MDLQYIYIYVYMYSYNIIFYHLIYVYYIQYYIDNIQRNCSQPSRSQPTCSQPTCSQPTCSQLMCSPRTYSQPVGTRSASHDVHMLVATKMWSCMALVANMLVTNICWLGSAIGRVSTYTCIYVYIYTRFLGPPKAGHKMSGKR